jgi:hypothetical protein
MSIEASEVQELESLDDFIRLFENRETRGYGEGYAICEAFLALAKANKKEIEALRIELEEAENALEQIRINGDC